ncbi:putative JLP2 DnaJ-Like Protein 2 [Ilyonectria robusta]
MAAWRSAKLASRTIARSRGYLSLSARTQSSTASTRPRWSRSPTSSRRRTTGLRSSARRSRQLPSNDGRMRPSKLRSGRRKSGRRTTHMMICSRRKTWRPRATRTATRIGKMISCSHKSFNYWRRAAPQKEVITKVVIQHPIS